MTVLTDKQRATLDAAEQILVGVLTSGEEVLMFSLHRGWEGLSTTYFTPNKVQHSVWVAGLDRHPTLSDKVARALEIRADEEGRADEVKAERVEKLRAELASLTGAAA